MAELFGEIKALGKSDNAQALACLRCAAAHVKNVMNKRGWRVCQFLPPMFLEKYRLIKIFEVFARFFDDLVFLFC